MGRSGRAAAGRRRPADDTGAGDHHEPTPRPWGPYAPAATDGTDAYAPIAPDPYAPGYAPGFAPGDPVRPVPTARTAHRRLRVRLPIPPGPTGTDRPRTRRVPTAAARRPTPAARRPARSRLPGGDPRTRAIPAARRTPAHRVPRGYPGYPGYPGGPNDPSAQPGYPGYPGYPPGLAYQAPKPGCVPLRPLGLSDILDGTFTAIRRNPKVMLGLSAAVGIASALVMFAAQAVFIHSLRNVSVRSSSDPTGETSLGALLGGEAGTVLAFIISLVLGAFLTGMLTIAITQDALGHKLSIGEVWQRVRPRLVRLVLLSLIIGTVPIIGLFFCIAPGVWLWGIWTVAVPAMMVERTKVFESLGRSFTLVKGTFWRVWGIRALGTLIAVVIGSMISVPFGLASGVGSALSSAGSDAGPSLLALALAALGSAVSTTITAPIRSGIDALLYVDLRMRKEGLDIALRQAVSESAASGPVAPRPGPFG